MRRILLLFVALLLPLSPLAATVKVAEIRGAISPASASYFLRALAEAERERRAKIIHAEGEQQASEKLLEAARVLAQSPQAMQLRYLQTLTNIAGDKTSTILFPMPIDLMEALSAQIGEWRAKAREEGQP